MVRAGGQGQHAIEQAARQKTGKQPGQKCARQSLLLQQKAKKTTGQASGLRATTPGQSPHARRSQSLLNQQ
jgi:hypothetical protein